MKKTVDTLSSVMLSGHGKRAISLLVIIALPVLLLFLGCSELFSVEGEWAAGVRLMHNRINFRELWQPENWHSLIFCRLINLLSQFFSLNETLIRMPSVLAALVLLLGTMVLALRISDRKNALLAGWLMLGSYGFLYWGRVGSDTIMAAALTVWCAVLFYGPQRRNTTLLRHSFDFTIFFCGTLFLCGITAALGILLLLLPKFIEILKTHRITRHGVVSVVLAVIPAVAVTFFVGFFLVYVSNTGLTWLEIFQRWKLFTVKLFVSSWQEFISPSGSGFPESLLHLPRLLLPWTLFVPAAVVGLWKQRGKLSGELKRLICGIVLYFCFIGIVPCRRWGELLPLLAPAVIVLAAGLSIRHRDVKWSAYSEIIVRGVFIVVAALAAALICTWPLWNKLLSVQPPVLLILVSCVAGIVALAILTFCIEPGNIAEKLIKRPAPLAGTVLAGVILSVLVNCVIFPQMNLFRTGRTFWKKCAVELSQCEPAPEFVIFYRCSIPENAIYYLNLKQRFREVYSPQEAEALLRGCGGKVAVITRCNAGYLKELVSVAKSSGRRFEITSPLCTENKAAVFVNSDTRSPESLWGLWMPGL